jgi:hypothetical protein
MACNRIYDLATCASRNDKKNRDDGMKNKMQNHIDDLFVGVISP